MTIDLGHGKVVKTSDEVRDISTLSLIMLEDIYDKYGKILDSLLLVDSVNFIFRVNKTDRLVRLSTDNNEYPTCLSKLKEILSRIATKATLDTYVDNRKYSISLISNTYDKKTLTINDDLVEYYVDNSNYIMKVNMVSLITQNITKIDMLSKIIYKPLDCIENQSDVFEYDGYDFNLEIALSLYLIYEHNNFDNDIEDSKLFKYIKEDSIRYIIRSSNIYFVSLSYSNDSSYTDNILMLEDGRNSKIGIVSMSDSLLLEEIHYFENDLKYVNECVHTIMYNYGIGELSMSKLLDTPIQSLIMFIEKTKYGDLPTDVLGEKSLLAREYIERVKMYLTPEEYKTSIEYLEGVKVEDKYSTEELNVAKYIFDNVITTYVRNDILSGKDNSIVEVVLRNIAREINIKDNSLTDLEIMYKYIHDYVIPKSMLNNSEDYISTAKEFVGNQLSCLVTDEKPIDIREVSQLICRAVEESSNLEDIASNLIVLTSNKDIKEMLDSILGMLNGKQKMYGVSAEFRILCDDGLVDTLIEQISKYLNMI